MKTLAFRGLRALMLACALLAGAAHAQPLLQPILQARWVLFFGEATVQGRDGASASDSAFHYQPLLPDNNFAPFDITDHLALDVAAPDGTAAVHVDGSMRQASSFGLDSFAYDGRVTAAASATGTPGPLSKGFVGGAGPHADFMGVFFDLRTPVTAVLSLHAEIGGGGSFVLRLAPEIGDDLVFQSVAGDASIPAQKLVLQLPAGRYSLSGDLNAFASLGEQSTATAGFAFSVTPVPEPHTWLLLLAGGSWIIATRMRRRR